MLSKAHMAKQYLDQPIDAVCMHVYIVVNWTTSSICRDLGSWFLHTYTQLPTPLTFCYGVGSHGHPELKLPWNHSHDKVGWRCLVLPDKGVALKVSSQPLYGGNGVVLFFLMNEFP